jgi:hypothetical protein
MALLIFFALIAVFSWVGLGADSRDSADWKDSLQGVRAARWR